MFSVVNVILVEIIGPMCLICNSRVTDFECVCSFNGVEGDHL